MRLPGFNAESSVYKTTSQYQMAVGVFDSGQIIPQLTCSKCYCDDSGACVQDCVIPCPPGVKPNGCPTEFTRPCRAPGRCSPPCSPPPPCCPPGCRQC
jgi:hypothetical protein